MKAFVTKGCGKKEAHGENCHRGSTSEILGDLISFERSPVGGVSHVICLLHFTIFAE